MTSNLYEEEWDMLWENPSDCASCDDEGLDIVLDSSGNIYIIGNTENNAESDIDVILLKYDSSGNLLWNRIWGGSEKELGNALALDSYDNIYVTGGYQYPNDQGDIFLLKYDSDGNFLWNLTWGNGSYGVGNGIAVDSLGDIYITGSAGCLYQTFWQMGIILKYDSFGNLEQEIFIKDWNGHNIALDNSGNIYITGRSFDAKNYVMLSKYDTSGNLLWSKTWSIDNKQYAGGLVLDSSGNAYITGYIDYLIDDPDTYEATIFILKFDLNGNQLWEKIWDNSSYDRGRAITIDNSGTIYITGYTRINTGDVRLILLMYNSSGNLVFKKIGPPSSGGGGIALDSWGNIYITGFIYVTDFRKLLLLNYNKDTDGDGLSDKDETGIYGTNPNESDTDGDGLSDYIEIKIHMTDPTNSDTDGDGLSDYDEINIYSTDPTIPDTDGDGFSDGQEIQMGTDPRSFISSPTFIVIISIIIGTVIIALILVIKRKSIKNWKAERKESKKSIKEKREVDRREREGKERDEVERFDKAKLEKKIELENKFPFIDQMIQEKKFSEATKEIDNIVEVAKSLGLISVLNRAREKKKLVKKKKENKILAFISYSMIDSDLFKIKEIAEKLTSFANFEDVLFCEEDTRDNFVKYMNRYVGECDVMILFCSPNSLNSGFVEDEWMAAHAMKKPIIPVFINTEDIPPLLKARVGITFDPFDLQKNIDELHKLILKKMPTEIE